MATKAYTNLGQSKVLALFLPLKSADMYYDRGGLPSLIDKYVTHESIKNDEYHYLIPCWSLAALLNVLPKSTNISTPRPTKALGYCCWNQYDEIYADNPVDACYEMVLKLYELKIS